MNQDQKNMLTNTLALYGAKLSEDNQIYIRSLSGVQAVIKKDRLRFERKETKDLIMSGAITEKTVCNFVEKFWFWEKV